MPSTNENTTKALKGKMTLLDDGFTTTHYYKNQFIGESKFKMTEHFGWTFNNDGSVTIAAAKVAFNMYGVGRGMMETLTNAYAPAKTEGLDACITMFKDRLTDLYNGVIARSGSKKVEDTIDFDTETLRHIIKKSLIKEYKFTNKVEIDALAKFIDMAARLVEERNGVNAVSVKTKWLTKFAEEIEEIPAP